MALAIPLKKLKLTPAEKKDIRLLFTQSLLSGFGASFFFVVVTSYFIQKTSIASLPPAYVLSGVFGFLLMSFYRKLQQKAGAFFSYSVGFIIYGMSGILLYFARLYYPAAAPATIWIAYIGFVIVLPYATMQALGFATICLQVFNISQSKRLLALIGTGEILASAIAYLTIPLLTKLFGGSAPLLLMSGIFNIAAIIPLRQTYKNNKEKLDAISFHAPKRMDISFFKTDKFYLHLAVVTIFSVMAVSFADYSYLLSVRYIAAESGFSIAIIVSIVFSIIKLGEFVFSLLSGSIIRAYGMKMSLLLLPALLVLSSVIGFSASMIFLSIPFFIVFFLLLNKWFERVIRKGVTIPATKVVYQVTDPAVRAPLQSTVEGPISQFAAIIAGCLLWIFSISLHGSNLIVFLRATASAYIVVFALWSWATMLLYNNYKVKIAEYLNKFGRVRGHNDLTAINDNATGVNDQNGKPGVGHNTLVQQALEKPLKMDLASLSQYISFYNPHVKTGIGEKSILRKARNAYYSNENFFSRLVIIRYMEFEDAATRVNFVKEYIGISELGLRLQMMRMLNTSGYRATPDDKLFFTTLCQDIAAEIIWAESSVNDISEKADQKLTNALQYHISTLQLLLFEVLKIIYDKDSIAVVEDILKSKDKSLENRLFAIELLDNILEPGMKKLLMPIMEDNTFSSKKEQLEKLLLIYELQCEDRLKEVLMGSYVTISPYIKQLALEDYYRLTEDKIMLNAFASSHVENLNATATGLLNRTDELLYKAKRATIENLNLAPEINPDILAYFAKWGIFSRSKRKHQAGLHEYASKQTFQFNPDFVATVDAGDIPLSVDLLGLLLIFNIDN